MRQPIYVWKDEARSLEIDLALPVVQRLGLEAMEAFKAVPRRGLEIGGLLLGVSQTAAGRRVIRIEDYADVPSEHRSGPSYQLSPADLETLGRIYADHPEAIGMYRTVTHSESLALQEDDRQLFERHFSRGGLFLLLHPSHRTAAFCLPGPAGLSVAHEFPFQTADLAQASAGEDEATAERSAAAIPVWRSSPWIRVWLVRAAALGLGAILGAVSWRLIEGPPSQRQAGAAAAVAKPPARTGPAHVALNVRREGRVLRLEWDRNAPAIRGADRAILQITDGNHQTNLNLTPVELNAGLLSYWADTPDVAFRLKVSGAGGQTDDSLRASIEPAGPTPLLQPPPATGPQPTPPRTAKAARRSRQSEESEADTASRAVPATPRPSPFTPPAKPEPEPAPVEAISTPAPRPAAAPPAPPTRSSEPRVEVSAEPVVESRLSRAVHHIPLLRRIKKNKQSAVPPEPISETRPTLSAAERRGLTGEVPIDVRVYVTEAGKVDYAELLDTRPASRHRDLADAAVFAARRWDFRPAHLGDENVPSEVILHFRFKPAEPPQP